MLPVATPDYQRPGAEATEHPGLPRALFPLADLTGACRKSLGWLLMLSALASLPGTSEDLPRGWASLDALGEDPPTPTLPHWRKCPVGLTVSLLPRGLGWPVPWFHGVKAGGTWGPIPFIQRNHPSGSDLSPLPSYQALLPKYKKAVHMLCLP